MMEENTFNYLVVEDDIVVNKCVGTIDTSFAGWVKETYPVGMRWKLNHDLNTFIPAEMTTEQFNTIKTNILTSCQEKKEYYEELVKSDHFKNNLEENIQIKIDAWLIKLNQKITDIQNNNGYVMAYKEGHSSYTFSEENEPLQIRPNIESEA